MATSARPAVVINKRIQLKNRSMKISKLCPLSILVLIALFSMLLLAGCSSGGGGGDDDTDVPDDSGDSDGDSDGGVSNGELTGSWDVSAPVTLDGCGERISNVTQTFEVSDSGGALLVDSHIVEVAGTETGDGFTAGFSETNGSCSRDYQLTFSGVGDTSALVNLSARSNCGGTICENTWAGVATKAVSTARLETKVRGSNCVPAPPEIGYRPSVYECNGNAAILLRGTYRSAYSVVVRRNGQFNDRDPANPSCGTNRCSPFKVQKRIELPEYQVNCLGETGFSANYAEVTRISVKFTALITNADDESQFQQYCLDSRTTDMN